MSDLSRQLSGKNTAERARIKAEAHKSILDSALLEGKGKWAFTLGDGRRVVVERVELGTLDARSGIVTPRKDGGADPIWVRLTVDGKRPNGDGWYGFVNPPACVPDGTTREETDPATGETLMVENTKEDIGAAFVQMLQDVL